MRRFIILMLSLLGISLYSQEAVVKGRIIDTHSAEPILEADIHIHSSNFITISNHDGLFEITSSNLPQGEQVLVVSKSAYYTQRIRIVIIKGDTVNLDPILLEQDLTEVESQIGIISLSDQELDIDEGTSYAIPGLLTATKDVFLNAAAYDFSATFFRPRGLDNSYGKVLINGVEMNKQYSGRPQWGTWGGLNDVQRNREFSMGIRANNYAFGEVAGLTNINMRASQYRRGGRISYASSNRSYRGRVMASFSSGNTIHGWSYSVLLARRYGKEGYQEATFYDANSFFISAEKKLSEAHSLNLTAFYTPNRRGRATAITDEVRNLKGKTYNPNWGFQAGEKRSSRTSDLKEPVLLLSHYVNLGENTSLNTNLAYQFGSYANTRLDYGSSRNPAGNYYQRLPSYFLRNENPTTYDFQLAYLAEQAFINDGQLDWHSYYESNKRSAYASYSIQEDRVDDTQFTLNSILNSRISENLIVNGNLSYRNLKSENYAVLHDLLGAEGYLDIDNFGSGGLESNSDLQNINRVVTEGERYKYNYELKTGVISGFAQTQFKYNRIDFYAGLSAAQTNYQRIGLYQNGYFSEESRSLGAGEQFNFTTFGIKAGGIFKITGRHLAELNAAFMSKAPNLRTSFANPRQNNDSVEGLSEEKIKVLDISYIYRSPLIKARLSGYYVAFEDQADIGFFFTQNALGNEETSAFVQEIVTGIAKRNLGAELGIEANVLPTFKLKAAAAFGQNIYTTNPNLYLAGDDFGIEGNDISTQGIRSVVLQNYHVSGGPERAYQLGFEYRDPAYWWVGVTANYFSNAYVDISHLRRTSDFYTDLDGQPFNDYIEETARSLLKQEQFDDYTLVNIVGGKSWRIKGYYVGFFATVNNVLNKEYKTGGFEDSRRASYRQQLEEQNRKTPVFGNRYFFGNGTTYYANIYLRF